MTQEQADCIVAYLTALEEFKGNATAVMRDLKDAGYDTNEVDLALKALGKIAGRDCSLF